MQKKHTGKPARKDTPKKARFNARPPRVAHQEKKRTLVHGTMIILSRGGGIVRSDDFPEEIKIFENDLNTALHGDEVSVQILGKKQSEVFGRVIDIGLRAKTEFTGVLEMHESTYYLKPADPKMYTRIRIPHDALLDAAPGDRVYGTLVHWKDARTLPEGRIIRRLGRPLEHEAEMQAIALERGFEEAFPPEVLVEAQAIEARGITKDDLKDRRDFRSIPTFTIDPIDAKDFDDAISVQRLPSGDIEIGIHIADVSHYVMQKTMLDTEALERGTSVYLVDRTIPMLPRALSDDLCSLLPHVDRLCMSAVVTFGKDLKEKDAWFGPTVIHSAHRFTYEEAQDVLDGKFTHALKDELFMAAEVARALGALRAKTGALILETEEVKVLIDAEGNPTGVKKKIRTESHTLIEELMLLANRRIAKFLEDGGKTGKKNVQAKEEYAVIYRVHDSPSTEKADDLAFFMRSVGHPVPVGKDGHIDPKSLQTVLKKLDGSALKDTVLAFVIRSMAKAIYTTKNIGHYGLQFKEYTHFTSPIRRYPDLVIHRLLRYALAGKPAPAATRKAYERVARMASLAEMRAADAERESVKFKLTQLMAQKVGQEIVGIITGVTEWGLYVKDKETTAEGLVGLRTMSEDTFTFDPRRAMLVAQNRGQTFRIGDTIRVKVVAANPERRQIDYALVS